MVPGPARTLADALLIMPYGDGIWVGGGRKGVGVKTAGARVAVGNMAVAEGIGTVAEGAGWVG